MTVQYLVGNVLEQLAKLPDQSVNCVITSPPYWLMRSYLPEDHPLKEFEIGLEPTPDLYVAKLVSVFREVRRVLRDDGTLFINEGDCYITPPPGNKPNTTAHSFGLGNSVANQEMRRSAQAKINKVKAVKANGDGLYDRRQDLQLGQGQDKQTLWGPRKNVGLQNKDLVGMPWRLALALQADGWILRRDIIWSKPNPMPEKAKDRCTTAHEYIFHFSKKQHYYYDGDAIREEETNPGQSAKDIAYQQRTRQGLQGRKPREVNDSMKWVGDGNCEWGRNKRSVWIVPVEQFSDAHSATFPQALVEPMIKAGCPQGGVVLDPFSGAGTVGLVASKLQRNAILIELWDKYATMAKRRIQRHAGLVCNIAWNGQKTPTKARPKAIRRDKSLNFIEKR